MIEVFFKNHPEDLDMEWQLGEVYVLKYYVQWLCSQPYLFCTIDMEKNITIYMVHHIYSEEYAHIKKAQSATKNLYS